MKRKLFSTCAWIALAATVAAPIQAQSVGDIFKKVVNGATHGNDDRDDRDDRDDAEHNRRRQNNAGGIGCAAGGIAGALLGKSVLGKVALGGALCAVGWQIGRALTKRDQQKLTERSGQLLEEDGPRSEVWTAPDSKEKVRLSVGRAEQRNTNVQVQYDRGVQAPPSGMRVEAATYVVTADRLNFRAAPSARDDRNIIGYFDRGENVEVLGRTADGQWAMIGDGGVLIGYAAVRAGGVETLRNPNAAQPTRKRRVVARARPKVIQKASQKGAPPVVINRNPQTAQVKTAKVSATTQCKAIVAQTGSKSDTHNGCTLPNGQWAIA